MTTIRWASIMCDGCGMQSRTERAMRFDPGAAGVRRKLRKNGWRRAPRGIEDGKDYCATCAPEHPEAK